MTITKAITNETDMSSSDVTNVKDGWGRVLVDAEDGLRQAQERVRLLKRAIVTIRTKVAAGEPFPACKSNA